MAQTNERFWTDDKLLWMRDEVLPSSSTVGEALFKAAEMYGRITTKRSFERTFSKHVGVGPGHFLEKRVPLSAIPAGFRVAKVSSVVDADGGLQQQTVTARQGGLRSDGPVLPQQPDGHYVKGVSTLVSFDENGAAERRLQWVKTSREQLDPEAAARMFADTIQTILPPKLEPVAPPTGLLRTDVLSVIPIGDPHIGMLAWAEEAGESYDLKIAEKLHVAAVQYLIQQGEPTEKALLINLGDFFHTDNTSNSTVKSNNPLDVDSRYRKIIDVGLRLLVSMIELLLQVHREVHIISEAGNHDPMSGMWLPIVLSAWYRNEPRVVVDMSPAKAHYYSFGRNLVMTTHGDTLKRPKDPIELENAMLADRPVECGNAKHRYIYAGHHHHSGVVDLPNSRFERFRTLAPKDAWHAAAFYRGMCDMTKIFLHRDHGEVSRVRADAKMLKLDPELIATREYAVDVDDM